MLAKHPNQVAGGVQGSRWNAFSASTDVVESQELGQPAVHIDACHKLSL